MGDGYYDASSVVTSFHFKLGEFQALHLLQCIVSTNLPLSLNLSKAV